MARTAKPTRAVHADVEIADDLRLHVSTVTEAGVNLVDIRQYIPSLKTYSRGVTVPQTDDIVVDIIDGLEACRSKS